MKFRNFLAGSLASLNAVILSALPATAGDINNIEQHRRLRNSLQQAGITVVINSPTYCDGETAGLYASFQRLMVICQERARAPYKEIGWTPYDLDTLRHEAHHVVQYCNMALLGDNEFDNLFDENKLSAFVKRALSEKEIDWIIMSYGHQSEDVILAELEAFAVAKSVDAGTIADAVDNLCSNQF